MKKKRKISMNFENLVSKIVKVYRIQEDRQTPGHWSPGICELLDRLLIQAPGARISTLKELKQVRIMNEVDLDKVLAKQTKPPFTPPKDHLNCDPTFELEEMIIETKPLHKKKKRLAKQRFVSNIFFFFSFRLNSPKFGANYINWLYTIIIHFFSRFVFFNCKFL